MLTKTVSDKNNHVINDLPQALQQELNIYTKIKLIKNVHIFKSAQLPA